MLPDFCDDSFDGTPPPDRRRLLPQSRYNRLVEAAAPAQLFPGLQGKLALLLGMIQNGGAVLAFAIIALPEHR